MLPLEISLIERRISRSKFHSSDLKDRADSSPVLSQSPINFLEEWLRESHCPLLTRCRNGPLQPLRNLLKIIRDDWGCVRGLCAVDHLRYRGHVFPLACNINKTQISCWSCSRSLQIIWKPGLTHLQVHFHSNICMKDFLPCYKYPFGPCLMSLKNEIWTPTLKNSFFRIFFETPAYTWGLGWYSGETNTCSYCLPPSGLRLDSRDNTMVGSGCCWFSPMLSESNRLFSQV